MATACGVYRSRTVEFMRRRRSTEKPSRLSEGEKDGADESLISSDLEAGGSSFSKGLPPEWIDNLDEMKELMRDTTARMKDLTLKHKERIDRPGFDGGAEQEQEIEIMTGQITAMFHKNQKLIQTVGRKSQASSSEGEKRMAKNVIQSAARDLQDLSLVFRKSQSQYLKRLRGREERANRYGADPNDAGPAYDEEEDEDVDVDMGFNDEQQSQLKDNTRIVKEREGEITKIVESIHSLTDIFKDLAMLVVDQGTVLDRIDYNIEMTVQNVEKGVKNLESAEKYQKSATKKRLILLLVVICVGIFFAIIFKSKVVDEHTTTGAPSAPTPPPPNTPAPTPPPTTTTITTLTDASTDGRFFRLF